MVDYTRKSFYTKIEPEQSLARLEPLASGGVSFEFLLERWVVGDLGIHNVRWHVAGRYLQDTCKCAAADALDALVSHAHGVWSHDNVIE